MAAAKKSVQETKSVVIEAPKFHIAKVHVRGDSNFVSNAFPTEAREMMAADMKKGTVDKAKRGHKPPKDFQKGFDGSLHKSTEGWFGNRSDARPSLRESSVLSTSQ